MAYIQDDPKDQEKNETQGMNVIQTGTAAPQEGSEGQNQGSQPSGGQGSVGTATPPPSSPIASQAAKAAPSSGMASNVKKYIQANQPQAAKMASAATQKVGNQAQKIGQAAEQKRSALQGQIAANQQKVTQQVGQAQSTLQGIMGDQSQAPTAEQSTQFQQASQGKFQGLQDVQNINLAQQQARSKALQGLASSSQTEAGRNQLLRQTFGEGRAYTRGQSGLDSAILGTNAAAQGQLTSGLDQTVSDLRGQLQTAGQGATSDMAAGIQSRQDAASGLLGEATGNVSGLDTQMQASLDSEIANRVAMGENYENAVANAQRQQQAALSGLGEINSIQDVAKFLRNKGLTGAGSYQLDDIAELGDKSQFINKDDYTSDMWGKRTNTGTTTKQQYLNLDENRLREVLRGVTGGLGIQGFGDNAQDELNKTFGDVWKNSFSNSKRENEQVFDLDSLQNALQDMRGRVSDRDVQGEINSALQSGLGGTSYADFTAGKDIDKYDTAAQGDVDKYNALQNLLGREDIIDQSRRQTGYKQSSDLQALLQKYTQQDDPEAPLPVETTSGRTI